MRILKIILITLILGGLVIPLVSCGSASDEAELSESQVVTVQRGNLTIDITASGNLALSRTEDLAFNIFYPEATVEEVLVEEGDTVEEGQVLARLDTSAWEDELTALERQLTAAKRQLTAKERELTTVKRQVTAKELALIQAQINLQTAEYNLSEITEVKKIDDAIEEEELRVNLAKVMLMQAAKSTDTGISIDYWRNEMAFAQTRIAELKRDRQELLAGSSVTVTTDVAIEVATKKLQVDQALRQLEDAQIAIEDARIDVDDAQKALDEALDTSPEIMAPFAGFITKVNVEGGDEVMTGTVAVTLADPNKFEADIMVSEMDILQVKLGGEAWVTVDAMQGLSLPAKVTHIAPTATIQQGVVNYKVKVEVQPLEAVMEERQQAMQEAREKIQQGELPERLRQAIEEGRLTQEQAEEMMKQRQQGQRGQQGQVPMTIPGDFQLRQGLTVTVSIIVDERSDVLLVPNAAIARQGMETIVQVLKDGVLEERSITTGISNWQYTEVISGLSEGEKVVVPKGTTTTPTTPQPRRPPLFFPPPGGRPR